MVGSALAAMLKEVFKLKNITRANGQQGHFTVVEHEFAGVKMRKYLDRNAKESLIPTALSLGYDE